LLSENDRAALFIMAETGISKLVYVEMDHPERLTALRSALMRIPGVDVTSSWFTNLEIMPKNIHKGFAVRRLAARLGIRMDQVIAFGDNDNDALMLSEVGYGVAMGNAADAARRAALYTTDTNLRDGVAKALRRFILTDSLSGPSISA